MAQSIGPSTINAAGNSRNIGANTYEYAIGEVVAGNTFANATLIVTPGVLQPNLTPSGVTPQSIAAGDMKIFPSPVETTLFLQPSFNAGGTLKYALYDAAGKLVVSKESKLSSGKEQQSLEVAPYAAGDYVLQVLWIQAGKQYSAGYKVQKLR
jgi:hypothetical protein